MPQGLKYQPIIYRTHQLQYRHFDTHTHTRAQTHTGITQTRNIPQAPFVFISSGTLPVGLNCLKIRILRVLLLLLLLLLSLLLLALWSSVLEKLAAIRSRNYLPSDIIIIIIIDTTTTTTTTTTKITRSSSVSIVTRIRTPCPGFDSWQGQGWHLSPTQPVIKWVQEEKRPGLEAHLYVVQRLRTRWTIPPILHRSSWRGT